MKTLRLVSSIENDKFLNCLLTAFFADPTIRYMWPESSQFLNHFKTFADSYCGNAVINQTAWTKDNFAGVAAWLGPNKEQDEDTLIDIIVNTCPGERVDEILGLLDTLSSYHPKEACWYLPMIGVDPNFQRHGYGMELMSHMLHEIDRRGLPVYLESSNPENITLYQKCGFDVMDRLELGGQAIVTPMIRGAKKH